MQENFLERNKLISSRLRLLREKYFKKSRAYMEKTYGLNPNSLKNIEDKYPELLYIWDLCKKNPQLNIEWIIEGDSHPMLKELPK